MLNRLNKEIKEAMKAKEKEKLQALRYMKSMLMENSTSKKPVPEMDVIVRHHKNTKEAIESYPDGHDMKVIAQLEITIIETYLPKQLCKDEVQAIINTIKADLENPNMGAIMKELQPKIKGQFDGKKAADLVKNSL
ncbi:MAG: GatB/YqeY domain-containing protein [Bacteriovoracaceae bacterium]|jgi:uncharacterized protein|nr:GatB/YqeY domain-containing protein [Bacteriovoracaceae bacterium]